jgi:hypothetical protein
MAISQASRLPSHLVFDAEELKGPLQFILGSIYAVLIRCL